MLGLLAALIAVLAGLGARRVSLRK